MIGVAITIPRDHPLAVEWRATCVRLGIYDTAEAHHLLVRLLRRAGYRTPEEERRAALGVAGRALEDAARVAGVRAAIAAEAAETGRAIDLYRRGCHQPRLL